MMVSNSYTGLEGTGEVMGKDIYLDPDSWQLVAAWIRVVMEVDIFAYVSVE